MPSRRQIGVGAGWRGGCMGSCGPAAVDAVLVVNAGCPGVFGGRPFGRSVPEDAVDAGHAGRGAVGADG